MDIEFPDNTPPRKDQSGNEPFGEIIYSYTRKQAIADGFQVDVCTIAKKAGIKLPVRLTRSIHDKFVPIPEGVTGQNEAGRLWAVVWMLRCAIAASLSMPFA